MLPVLKKEYQDDPDCERLLCTLANHQKPVNSVRWAPNGQYLASASDDATVILWRQRPEDPPEGSDDVESWTTAHIFRGGHERGSHLQQSDLGNWVYSYLTSFFSSLKTFSISRGLLIAPCWPLLDVMTRSPSGMLKNGVRSRDRHVLFVQQSPRVRTDVSVVSHVELWQNY